MNIDPDLLDDDLSSAMGTETLLNHDLVSDGLPASSREPAEQQIHRIKGARYLVVSQTANQRHDSQVSRSGNMGWSCVPWICMLPVYFKVKYTYLYSLPNTS